tara:strand:+ start:1200 stop:1814 length:615 start_codon:yes stop_codon:yes gene_type:complete
MIVTREKLKQVTGFDYYEGSVIHNRFAYKFFQKETMPNGNIVAFRAPMKVETDGMIDSEDVMANDFIYSNDAINFIYEVPHLDPFGAVAYQRLFNSQIANFLHKFINAPIEMDGDDLICHKEHQQRGILQQKGKASVSIVHCKNGAALGHTAVNIQAGEMAPSHAFSTNLTDEEAVALMTAVTRMFYELNEDIFLSSIKVFAIS